jgi:hypothetical protein
VYVYSVSHFLCVSARPFFRDFVFHSITCSKVSHLIAGLALRSDDLRATVSESIIIDIFCLVFTPEILRVSHRSGVSW